MKNVTFNDLPELVSELNEKISSLESKLDVHLAASGQKKENTHVPMRKLVPTWEASQSPLSITK